uniref:Latent transforming growth factor beta binding protein 2 n=1 Tax=Acanthochromis polyacanthus TaxID=80966 RepID=A0A3Q1GGJ8_9TELE
FPPDVDECALPGVCLHGRCVNLDGTHKCTCNHGYQVTSDSKSCEDVNECATGNACPAGICINTAGSYTCQDCRPGFGPSADGLRCEDVDECAQGDLCLGGVCANTDGSYTCTRCKTGYRVSQDRQRCEDVDECALPTTCPQGTCTNTEGSFTCVVCQPGFRVSEDGQQCDGEASGRVSAGIWFRLYANSIRCDTRDGNLRYDVSVYFCPDVDECLVADSCPGQLCLNTPGSYTCRSCDDGFQLSKDGHNCEDMNECEDTSLCVGGHCTNTDGSYSCVCPSGLELVDGTHCRDINECLTVMGICGEGDCLNSEGSFSCVCSNGYTTIEGGTGCRVKNPEKRKECYYNVDDRNFCDNVLSRNITKQECCCTVGSGWGDNCEIHPCPVLGRGTTASLCPHGSGLIPLPVSSTQSLGEQRPYIDANECEMFESDICKNGRCSNSLASYTCFCRSGFYYDNIRLECVADQCLCVSPVHLFLDYDECEFRNSCENGECVNTPGSFNCFCSPPLVLDSTRRRCIGPIEYDHDVHVDICWQRIEGDNMCAEPLQGRRTTYTECCCLYGIAWSGNCAFCPKRYSGEKRDTHKTMITLLNNQLIGFEGLRAEECGVLNGCENGRCVPLSSRCGAGSCFSCGISLLTNSSCLRFPADINECKDISDKVPLCQNGHCTNTDGSYKCTCLPGFVASAKPHKCIPTIPEAGLREAGN